MAPDFPRLCDGEARFDRDARCDRQERTRLGVEEVFRERNPDGNQILVACALAHRLAERSRRNFHALGKQYPYSGSILMMNKPAACDMSKFWLPKSACRP